MLLEFGVKNFFSFKEGASVSLRLDANCPPNISQGLTFTPVMCVKGANASGKTNLLKSLAFLSDFTSRSFQKDPDDLIQLSAFGDSDSDNAEPSEFYVIFQSDGIEYEYELAATEERVVRETIYRTKNKKTKIVERINDSVPTHTKEFSRLATIKLRKNASLISHARQHEFDELAPIYNFFRKCISNVSFAGLRERPIDLSTVSELLKKHSEVLQFVKSFISQCDTGVNDIHIVEDEAADGRKTYFPAFLHDNAGKNFIVTDVTESSGTKALYRNLALYKITLDEGGVLILDEFDINLHPHILPKLLDLFLDLEINTKHAQLIFTTHNSEIMDMLGRYRTCLVNKEDNESYVYRLDELSGTLLRNDRAISPIYRDRKIGGVPRI